MPMLLRFRGIATSTGITKDGLPFDPCCLVASKQMSCVWLPHYMSGGSIPEDLLGWLCWSDPFHFFQGTCSSIFVPFLPCELTKLQSKMRTWQPLRQAKCGPTGVHGKPSVAQFGSPANQQTMHVPAGTIKIHEASLETRRLSKHVVFRRLGLSNHVRSWILNRQLHGFSSHIQC